MTTYFDRFSWDAQTYETVERLYAAVEQFGIKGKIIRTIHTIGMAHNMQPQEIDCMLFNAVRASGIPWKNVDVWRNTVHLPYEVRLCEPVVIVFEDDSTLEMKPDRYGGIRMSVNQVGADILDGLNCCNYDCEKFFARMAGFRLQDVTFCRCTHRKYGYLSVEYTWQLETDGHLGMFVRTGLDGWYTFGLNDQRLRQGALYKEATATPEDYWGAQQSIRQICLVEGHDCSSYFWIWPVQKVWNSEHGKVVLRERADLQVSVEEMDFSAYLYEFFERYFDKNFPDDGLRQTFGEPGFEWNLEHNFYTYKTIERLLQDMERFAELLRTDYDNPEVQRQKQFFNDWELLPTALYDKNNLTDAERERAVRENIGVVISFYERFARRLRSMMAAAADCDLITVMGP